MKRFIYLFSIIFSLFLISCGNKNNIQLPTISSSFLNKHFKDVGIEKIEQTLDLDYEVTLDNEVVITFERRGNWEEINARKSDITDVMNGILPYSMVTYLQTNYPDRHIRRVERKKYGYLVVLNKPNSVKIEFNKNGAFISVKEDK